MTDRDALLAAIKANPDDDTPRLVFADYLDEQGEGERAEFIRVQVELAKMVDVWRAIDSLDSSTSPLLLGPLSEMTFKGKPVTKEFVDSIWRCRELRARERELLGPHREGEIGEKSWEWFYRLAPWSQSCTPSRGFLSRIFCSWEDWQTHGDAILADSWVIRLDQVELTTHPEVEFGYEEEPISTLRGPAVIAGRGKPIVRVSGRSWIDCSDLVVTNAGPEEASRFALEKTWPQVGAWRTPPFYGGFPVPPEFTPAVLRQLNITQEMLDDTSPAVQVALQTIFGNR